MRRLLFTLAALFCVCAVRAQMTSKIDPRFELTSIAFRLAGAEEYSQCGVPGYSRDIDSHFLPYVEHPLIKFIQQIRRDYGISYDAVSSSADWMIIKGGKIKLKPGYDAANISKADARWTEVIFKRYMVLLNDFYRKAKFQEFYDAHAELYGYATGQLDALLATVDTGWFERYYGLPFGNPDIFIGLCNGPSNYALPSYIRSDGYGIVVGCGSDRDGKPAYGPMFINIILHEFAHNYSNPLLSQHWAEFEKAADVIYPNVAKQMSQIAYGNAKTTMGEWFNNLCVLMYLREMQPEFVDDYINYYEDSGFIWMGRSVKFMDKFYADRKTYPHISDFIPCIVEFINVTAADIEQVKKDYSDKRPYVTEVFPVSGSMVSASELPAEIVIRFSEPMNTGGYGFNYINRTEIIPLPLSGQPVWRDEYTVVLPLESGSLEKGKSYGMKLYGRGMRSQRGYNPSVETEFWFKVE